MIEKLRQAFIRCFQVHPKVIASAPGRLEILGNHTDYNEGFVLSCAVSQRIYAAVAPSPDQQVRLISAAWPNEQTTFNIAQADRLSPQKHWSNYIRGLIIALRERGVELPGFSLYLDSQVPASSGMSSSAALETAVVTALCSLCNAKLSDLEKAKVGQQAENAAVGAQTGLMDQLTSLCGRSEHLLESEYRHGTYHPHPMPRGYCLAAIDSGVKHDLTEQYNQRRRTCESAVAKLHVVDAKITSLRDVSINALDMHAKALNDLELRRARHIVEENHRVHEAVAALKVSDVGRLGQLLTQSHQSSRDNFENSCPQLDELVELAEIDSRCLGARLSGGGFGGITIHLLPVEQAIAYTRDLAAKWRLLHGNDPWFAVCRIGDGAHLEPIPEMQS